MGTVTKFTRRRFISSTALGIIGFPLLRSSLSLAPPSDTIRVGIVGLGRGERIGIWLKELSDVEVVAICDVDKVRLEDTHKRIMVSNPDAKVTTYTDFRQMLDRKDIDAVVCATPDHWHALIAIYAFQAGKDVYGEKPLCYTVEEGRAMLKAMEQNNRVFQLGVQNRASENYHRITEIIQSGKLGRIKSVRLWKTGGSPGLGFPPSENPPATLDWDRWLGPAPYAEYTPKRCHGSFRYFLDYSGGVFSDFWCHIANVMFMSVPPSGLYSIDSQGERPLDGMADAPRWIDVDFKFNDIDVYWTTEPPSIQGAEKMTIGAHFEGTDGSLTNDYSTRIVRIGNEVMDDIKELPKTMPRSPGHHRNFFDCVKSRQQPHSNLYYARELTLPMQLAMISFKLKRKLAWDSAREQFIGDDAANYFLSREGRAPWSLPK